MTLKMLIIKFDRLLSQSTCLGFGLWDWDRAVGSGD
jgi:hypothetical protein